MSHHHGPRAAAVTPDEISAVFLAQDLVFTTTEIARRVQLARAESGDDNGAVVHLANVRAALRIMVEAGLLAHAVGADALEHVRCVRVAEHLRSRLAGQVESVTVCETRVIVECTAAQAAHLTLEGHSLARGE